MSKKFATEPRNPKVKSGRGAKKNSEISLAPPAAPAVTSESNNEPGPEPNEAAGTTPTAATTRSTKDMTLTLTRSNAPRKSKRIVIYNIEGRTGSVQFLSTLFGGTQKDEGNPPASLSLSGEFAEPKAKVEKVKETPEERKARLAALPKLTLAEKVERAEKRAAELRAKLAAGNAA